MKILNIDISNTSIAAYSLDGACSEVTLSFSGIRESWQAKLVYATFVQDDLNPTVQVVDGSVEVPSEILENNTDFYVGLYAMTEGETQIEEPTVPVLVMIRATESSEINVEQLIKTIMLMKATINSLSDVAISGSYDDLLDKLIFTGSGNGSCQSANAGEAIADNSIALGPGTVSGVRGYYIKSVDLTAKKIYLTKTQTQPVMSTADNTDVTFETPAYEIGQEFVTVNSMHYWPINVTIKSVNHNVIEYDDPDGNGIGYTSFAVMAEAARDPHDFSFFVPMQPTIGGTSLKPGGVGIGYEVYVLSKYGFGGGYKCIVFGNYGTALGRGNRAGGSALAGGQDCWALANQSIALGLRLRAIADSQSVLGRHNRPDKTLAHMIGNGKSDVNRSNCHEVTWDGKAWYADKIYMGGASIHDPDAKVAATEEYVNIKSETAGGAGRWSLTPYIDGVSAGLKISLLYPIDYTVWRVWLEDKDISGELQPNNSFITAPLIFEDATKVKITLESDGVELLALSLNNVYKNDNIQIGNLLIKEEVTA